RELVAVVAEAGEIVASTAIARVLPPSLPTQHQSSSTRFSGGVVRSVKRVKVTNSWGCKGSPLLPTECCARLAMMDLLKRHQVPGALRPLRRVTRASHAARAAKP